MGFSQPSDEHGKGMWQDGFPTPKDPCNYLWEDLGFNIDDPGPKLRRGMLLGQRMTSKDPGGFWWGVKDLCLASRRSVVIDKYEAFPNKARQIATHRGKRLHAVPAFDLRRGFAPKTLSLRVQVLDTYPKP